MLHTKTGMNANNNNNDNDDDDNDDDVRELVNIFL